MAELISLEDLGFNNSINKSNPWDLARVTSEHKERYIVKNLNGEFEAEIIGNLRYTANSKLDFPAVGDWVYISVYDKNKALIHGISKRLNTLKRQAIGKESDIQIIATNIDYAFIVESVNRDFNINRFQRYLTICYDANIKPILVLNKIDLIDKGLLNTLKKQIIDRIPDVKLLTTSCDNKQGLDELKGELRKGKTYCFLGSSGVGKSSLINLLSGKEVLQTNQISKAVDRGKHTTTFRSLIVLKEGGILIDNPGMREVGISNAEVGLQSSFQLIAQLSDNCKFKDCSHIHEKGCAVLAALKKGELNIENYNNYIKMKREAEHYESSELERKQKGKNLSKTIRRFNNERK